MQKKIHYFYHGWADKNLKNAFKNCKHFQIYAIMLKILGCNASGISGKSPCDGIGGTVKRLVLNASLQLPTDLC